MLQRVREGGHQSCETFRRRGHPWCGPCRCRALFRFGLCCVFFRVGSWCVLVEIHCFRLVADAMNNGQAVLET
jgi:hypothetical protein